MDRRSCRFMQVDINKLQGQRQLGRLVETNSTQIKASVMQTASLSGQMPKFSRMSGIQEWENAVMLFVNVYGDCYKNVFLNGGFVFKSFVVCFLLSPDAAHPVLLLFQPMFLVMCCSVGRLHGSHSLGNGKALQLFAG